MSLSQQAIAQERSRRYQAYLDAFTPEAAADGHPFQLQALTSKIQNLILLCSRRAGKTWFCCLLLAMNAAKAKNANSNLYLALTSAQARKVWRKTWKRICKQFKLCQDDAHSETELTTTFPNGSTVQFGGTDDIRHIQSLLGDSMAGGIAIIDECQSDPGLIQTLVEDILGPMLDETTVDQPNPGRLVLAGTVPPVAVGYFYELFAKLYNTLEHRPKTDQELAQLDPEDRELHLHWQAISWSRADNPHETKFEQNLDAYCKKYGFDRTDPIVLRNWYGRCVFDTNDTAYRYVRSKNGYSPVLDTRAAEDLFQPGKFRLAIPQPGVDTFGIGLDPAASSDRFAIVMWGWSSTNPVGVWQVAEWSTDRGANAIESQYYAVIKWLVENFNVTGIIYDPGGSSTTKDPAFLSEYGLVIEPAKKGKGSKKARVDRLKDLLGTCRAWIMEGSALESDLVLARFDPEKRAVGKYEWTSQCHPDVADAGTYALPLYIEAAKKQPRPSPREAIDGSGQFPGPLGKVLDSWQKEQDRLAREAFKPQAGPYGYKDSIEQHQDREERFDDGSSYGGPN